MNRHLVDEYDMPIDLRTYNPTKPPPIVINDAIVDHNLPREYNIYDITFDPNIKIQTLVTSSPSHVNAWLVKTLLLHRDPHPLIVGLDIEWRRRRVRKPVATLQLCINRRCLVFQIIHAEYIPCFLRGFLYTHKFVGVGIKRHVEKLFEDYSIKVTNFVDLRDVACDELGGNKILRRAGLNTLAEGMLGKGIKKPKKIAMSRWDNKKLSARQVQYATIDAFASYGIALMAGALYFMMR